MKRFRTSVSDAGQGCQKSHEFPSWSKRWPPGEGLCQTAESRIPCPEGFAERCLPVSARCHKKHMNSRRGAIDQNPERHAVRQGALEFHVSKGLRVVLFVIVRKVVKMAVKHVVKRTTSRAAQCAQKS